jgi:cytochrome P450
VDVLLTAKDDTGKGLTLEEIRAEVDTFLFAGMYS